MNLLCWLGLHKWNDNVEVIGEYDNVQWCIGDTPRKIVSECVRCGKRREVK